jgi:hypothetical protein
MPMLPSGRRVELSQDRFMAHLGQLDIEAAARIYHALQEPDDLLFLLDVICYSEGDCNPYLAGFVASDWEANAQDWPKDDRKSFSAWLFSDSVRQTRSDAISNIKQIMNELEFPSSPSP